MKIKGRYVAQVEIDINVDASRKGLLPFEEIHEMVMGDKITDILREMLNDELFLEDEGKITVTKMYGDAYQVEGDQE